MGSTSAPLSYRNGNYAVGAITDAVDGHLARKNGQVTNFGKLLDPIADKILTTSALLAFMTMGLCNIWIVMIVLAREFAVASVRMIAAADGVVIPANKWGKGQNCQSNDLYDYNNASLRGGLYSVTSF